MTRSGRTIFIQVTLIIAASLFVIGCTGSSNTTSVASNDTKLVFDPAAYATVNITVDGTAVKVRQWKIVYVANPVEMASTQPQLGASGYTGEAALDTSVSPVA